jgi:hypothetical protein
MKDKSKTIITVLCLTLTCFLTQCESCLKKDEVTKKPLPHQVMYTISFGFPFPYFDVKVKTGPDDGFYYTIDCSYKFPVTMAVNIPALALVFSLVLLLIKKGRVQINRLLAITAGLAVLFDSSLLIPYFPAFFETVFGYLYVYPIAFIGRIFELVKIELPDNNIPPRIYLAFLVVALYPLSLLLQHLIKMAGMKLRKR